MFSSWMPTRWRKKEKPRFRAVTAGELKPGDQFMCRRTGQAIFRILSVEDSLDWVEVTIRRAGPCHIGIIIDGFVRSEIVWRKSK